MAKASAQLDPAPAHLSGLFALYRASPEFTQLEGHAGQLPASDERAEDLRCEGPSQHRPAVDSEGPGRGLCRHRRWLANQVVAVLSIVLGWGVPRGIVPSNTAKDVPKIRRPKKLGVANKAWRPEEVDSFLKATHELQGSGSGLRKAVALAYYGGLRKEDVVRVPKTARSGGSIDMDMINKNGKELSIFEAKRLTAILNEPTRSRWGAPPSVTAGRSATSWCSTVSASPTLRTASILRSTGSSGSW